MAFVIQHKKTGKYLKGRTGDTMKWVSDVMDARIYRQANHAKCTITNFSYSMYHGYRNNPNIPTEDIAKVEEVKITI